MRNRKTDIENWPVSTGRMDRESPRPQEWVCTDCAAQAAVSGVGLCRRCSWRKQQGVEVRASPSVCPEQLPCCGGRCPAGQGQGGAVCRGVPGTQGDCMICRRCCRAHGPLEIFRNRISPVPRGCVSTCICVSVEIFRWLFPPKQGLRGRAELGRVPHLYQLPCGHGLCHPLLQHLSSQ